MAALEKIRKRAVILTIVIGAGLLAFILEEGVRASQSFFNDTTAARVGSDKIGVQEFNQRYEQMTQDNQNQQNKQTIDSIAKASGFSTVRTFQRLFKDRYGMTPAEFRESYPGLRTNE